MRVGIYSPYLITLGGGERYVLTVAEFFLKNGDNVDLFSDENFNPTVAMEKFALDLTGLKTVPNIFSREKFFLNRIHSLTYDCIFFLSDGSLPWSFSRKTIIHFQLPILLRSTGLLTKIKTKMAFKVVCNSNFTKRFVDKSFHIKSMVMYPPVDILKISPGRKTNLILTVGRFFSPSHPKKQGDMIEAFKVFSKTRKGWKFILAGGITGPSEDEIQKLRKSIGDFPIEIITDLSFQKLESLYSEAKIYWHGAGFGEVLTLHPDRAEHFGISTVEAMAGGCVPIVFNGGGQLEIVDDKINGYFWNTAEELIQKTQLVADNASLMKTVSESAIQRSREFSKEKFCDDLKKLINA